MGATHTRLAVLTASSRVPSALETYVSHDHAGLEAGLLPDGDGIRVISTEGGHTDFGPRSDLEVELYRYLATGGVRREGPFLGTA